MPVVNELLIKRPNAADQEPRQYMMEMSDHMITNEKLRIYERFNGDADEFSRWATPGERNLITDQEWNLIDELVQNVSIIQAGLASSGFEAKVRERVSEAIDDRQVRDVLFRLSKPRE